VQISENEKGTVPLCETYYSKKINIELSNNMLKYMIIGINVVLKMLIVKIIDWVGCDTQSSEMSFVMMAIFLTTVFNTGFLLLFVNGNMTE